MKIRNYIISILVGVVIAFACNRIMDGLHSNVELVEKYESLESKNDVLHRQCDSLQHIVFKLQLERVQYYVVVDSLKTEIDNNSVKINNIRDEHEKDIVRIDDMSGDELYQFFAEYIE